jgi:cyclohexa-1,5-dienecarbonyl-CoA hydratase
MSAPVEERLEEDGTLLRVLIDRPKGNVLDMETMCALEAVLDRYVDRPHLRMVLLRGGGGHFSFGASVLEHRADSAAAMLATFHRLIRQIAAYPVSVAALVEGQCLGAGFEVALVCHLVFATPSAVFGCPEIKLGVFPPVLAAVGAQRLGGATAERLLLTGNALSVESAERIGLLAAVMASSDPEEEVRAWFRRHLCPHSAWALREAVRAARAGSGLCDALGAPLERIERQYLERVVPSHDGAEGLNAFLERRPPRWEDR